ncbi:restriction endonuclease [Malikia sp.]|uniref:restriction endonuclease n=1 Tax=Malikia sp. TaxID=2070706 RepID=UPI002630223A|nr:restriction endonuclease [Malikia sp.]MDD2730342.1 restriction endonuclease [Malikia sp.]
MAVPTYDRFIEPILRFLAARPNGAPAREAHEATAEALQITEADRQEVLPSGAQPVYKNRAGWAHDRLKRAGLSDCPRRGYWQLTSLGINYVAEHPDSLSADELTHLATGYMRVQLGANSKSGSDASASSTTSPVLTEALLGSPDDRLGQALSEMRRAVSEQVLERLSTVSPSFFETIVLDLLHRMGYGAKRDDLQRVGGSGDGGIDGVISLDKLGLEKVYVQAKRWQSSVGRPEIQAFYGALAGQRAKKGVFITTSSYTTQAIDFARSVEGIVLVDGARLAELMIDHEVGVSARTVKLPKIDSDYFDEDAA